MSREARLFPALVVVLLSLPCLGFTFLWDDYHFLNNELTASLRDWLPQPDDPFYRPIPRALYFGIVGPLGTGGALVAHAMNLFYLAAATASLTLLATRLSGPTAGLIAGVAFAGMGAAPVLAGWASCSQDLLSINFVLLALLARWHQRNGLALLATAAALLSKETAVSAIPAIAAFDWILGRRPFRLGWRFGTYGTLVAAWAAIHPAVRLLLSRGLQPGATGYVGLTPPAKWAAFSTKYAAVLTNLRLGSFVPTWPPSTTLYLVLVALAAAFGFWSLTRRLPPGSGTGAHAPVASRRVVVLGLSLLIPPLLMTSTIIDSWAPYYAAFPMAGLSLMAGLGLECMRPKARALAVGLYLLLGIWARGSQLDELRVTERMLRPSSVAMRRIERGFRAVQPEFPPNSDIVLSVQARGAQRVYAQLYVFQPPRLWYRDATLRVWKPVRYIRHGRPEFLFIVTPDLDVVRLDPVTFATRSASREIPDYSYCERALRTYAYGLSGSGQADEGADILLRIPHLTEEDRSLHQRTAAMLLLEAGRKREGDSLIAVAPPMPRSLALDNLRAVLAEQPKGHVYDDYALRSFGIAPDDTVGLQYLASWFSGLGYAETGHRFAARLLALRPGDPLGRRALTVADSILTERRRSPFPDPL